MDSLVARAAADLAIGIDKLAIQREDKDSLNQQVEQDIQSAFRELLVPLTNDCDNYPYLLRKTSPAASLVFTEPDSAAGTDPVNAEASVGEAPSRVDVHSEHEALDEFELPSAEYVFVTGKTHVYAWEYLGEQWSSDIKELHGMTSLSDIPESICTRLHPWQSSGAQKLISLANSSFKGGILADEMGLGKTLQAITVGEKLGQGGLKLVVAPKSCNAQWQEELLANVYPPPRVLILDDPHMTANELLDARWDWVICSYEYVRSRYNVLLQYQAEVDSLEPRDTATFGKSQFFNAHKHYLKRRPAAPLHSEVYGNCGRPILAVFFDEVHIIKNEDRDTYKAARAIPARHRFMLSGTIFHNRWSDVFAPISFLEGHPFQTRAAFQKAFARQGSSATNAPTESKRARLIKFLQRLVIARPSSMLNLPNMEERKGEFVLDDPGTIAIICYLVRLFYQAFDKGRTDFAGLTSSPTNMHTEYAIYCINVAQCLADNRHMLRPQEEAYVDKIRAEAIKWAEEFVKQVDEVPGSAAYYHAVMKLLDKSHSNRKKSTKSSGRRQTKRLRPDPELALGMGNEGYILRKRRATAEQPAIVEVEDDGDDDFDPDQNDSGDSGSEQSSEEGGEEEDSESLAVPEMTQMQTANDRFEGKSSSALEDQKVWEKKLATMTEDEILSPRVREIKTLIQAIRRGYKNEKVLVFSRFRKMLDIVALALSAEAQVFRFDGTVAPHRREGVKASFSKATSDKVVVMLVTAGCGGAGLNLESANHVILVEPWWRVADERQAIGRVYRFGQTHAVHVWRLQAINSTVDHAMTALQERKAKTSDRIMKAIRMADGELPDIPAQFKGGAGEFY